MPPDEHAIDLIHWQTTLVAADVDRPLDAVRARSAPLVSSGGVQGPDKRLGVSRAFLGLVPDGHVLALSARICKKKNPLATKEEVRLERSRNRTQHWKRWGPYLSERAWGTVREDYSNNGTAWDYFPHDHARSRAYRWNEDGIAGICDRHQRLCFSLAL